MGGAAFQKLSQKLEKWFTVKTVNSRQKKGLNRAVDSTFLSERDAAVESGLSKVRQENVLLVIYSL